MQEIKFDPPRKIISAFKKSLYEIFADTKIILSSKLLKLFFYMNLIFRLIFHFFFHPNQPSSFAPDEGTYARLAEYVSRGKAVQDFPEYGPSLYNQSKSLISPSSFLIKLGNEPLDSVRIVSSLYGFLIPLCVLLCFVAVRKSKVNIDRLHQEFRSPLALFLLFFLFFIPSNFLWSTLGLRESASQFWILAQTYFLIKMYLNKKIDKLPFGLLALISSIFSFSSRPQTALLISIFIMILGILVAIRKKTLSFLLISIFSFIAGNSFASTPEVKSIEKWTIIEKSNESNFHNSENHEISFSVKSKLANSLCDFPLQVIELAGKEFQCNLIKEYRKPLLPPLNSLPTNVDVSTLEEKRNLNRLGASSALAPSLCSKSVNEFASIWCNMSEIPYRLSAFLLRPFPLIDQGSSFLFLAGMENVVWLILYLITLFKMAQVRRWSPLKEYVLSFAFFLILFSTAASLYEGNMGTAFRHRSTLIGHLVLLNLLVITYLDSKRNHSIAN